MVSEMNTTISTSSTFSSSLVTTTTTATTTNTNPKNDTNTLKDNNNNLIKINDEIDMTKMVDANSTLMIEDSVNGLQFQIRQEPGPNGQITYKVVPLSGQSSNENEIPLDHHNLNGLQQQQQQQQHHHNHHQQQQVIVTSASLVSQQQQQQQPVYLMVPTNDFNQASNVSPKSSKQSPSSQGKQFVKTIRDEKRRANHNEVERRRRDNINKWIVELSKVIPDCSNDHTKHGQSKGGILEKTVQYLQDLKANNQQLLEQTRHLDKLKIENELLKDENLKLHHTLNKITSLSQTTNIVIPTQNASSVQ